jgi:AcrR family transcriptional regulator
MADGIAPKLKRRDQNKQDKARRIKVAARELFLAKGFDNATMREIAKHANVALGTLFTYASDKRDLLFLIYNEEQEGLARAAFGVRRKGHFLTQLVAGFGVLYRFVAKQPEFMRFVLRELTFYSVGREALRLYSGREELISGIERIVSAAKKNGEIKSREPDRMIAQLLFSIYQAEVRLWLSGRRPNPTEGLHRLRRMLQLVQVGLRSPDGRRMGRPSR